ncbi:hypothetical protein P280DRAFT_522794 [Massarina eburnea CBS 473.64]|uniref:Uncharacterized protein n=1 Tax=Massarina eburnea CBS 473.64 TaxID=1395130 RepID=A0A6A6RJZ5_9PLEO|nr:hypothetical protein P280DRAFT_522794 [Massarina eburnea CBS 473.64]
MTPTNTNSDEPKTTTPEATMESPSSQTSSIARSLAPPRYPVLPPELHLAILKEYLKMSIVIDNRAHAIILSLFITPLLKVRSHRFMIDALDTYYKHNTFGISVVDYGTRFSPLLIPQFARRIRNLEFRLGINSLVNARARFSDFRCYRTLWCHLMSLKVGSYYPNWEEKFTDLRHLKIVIEYDAYRTEGANCPCLRIVVDDLNLVRATLRIKARPRKLEVEVCKSYFEAYPCACGCQGELKEIIEGMVELNTDYAGSN